MSASTPSIPKAEETHRLGYRIEGGAAMEVEGVCRFDESSVACWDAGGKPDQAITDRVKAGLDRGPDTSNLQIRYGMKNRILVVRQATPALVNGQGDRRSLNLMEVGPDSRYGSGGYVQLPEERVQWDPKVPSVRREARLFSVDRDARETRMRVMVSEPMPERAELKLSKGASATLNGVTWRVVSTAPAPERSPSFGMATGKMWTIKVALSGRPKRPASLYPQLAEMLYVDEKGIPLSQREHADWQRKQSDRAQKAFKEGRSYSYENSPYRPVSLFQNGVSGADGRVMELVTNADPQKLGKVALTGSLHRTVEVTGIPLDPR